MKIVYRRRAIADLDRIHGYIEHDNPAAAGSVVVRIRQAVERLADFPHSGRTGLRPGTRELVLSNVPYIAVYRLHGSGEAEFVEIVAVYHTAQDRLRH